MKKICLVLLFLASQSASAFMNCKLTVLSTTTIAGGVQWNYLDYENFTQEQCDDLCKDQQALIGELTPYELPINCKMKFTQEDGTIIRAKYRFIKWPSLSFRLTSDRHCRPY